jgi:hypothetical protein
MQQTLRQKPCRQMRAGITAHLQDVAAVQAASSESFQHKHKTVVKHAQALTKEMTQLAEGIQHQDALRKEQEHVLAQLQGRMEEGQCAADSRVQQLADQVEIVKHSASVANGCDDARPPTPMQS